MSTEDGTYAISDIHDYHFVARIDCSRHVEARQLRMSKSALEVRVEDSESLVIDLNLNIGSNLQTRFIDVAIHRFDSAIIGEVRAR